MMNNSKTLSKMIAQWMEESGKPYTRELDFCLKGADTRLACPLHLSDHATLYTVYNPSIYQQDYVKIVRLDTELFKVSYWNETSGSFEDASKDTQAICYKNPDSVKECEIEIPRTVLPL
jgi:hypothetical protein